MGSIQREIDAMLERDQGDDFPTDEIRKRLRRRRRRRVIRFLLGWFAKLIR